MKHRDGSVLRWYTCINDVTINHYLRLISLGRACFRLDIIVSNRTSRENPSLITPLYNRVYCLKDYNNCSIYMKLYSFLSQVSIKCTGLQKPRELYECTPPSKCCLWHFRLPRRSVYICSYFLSSFEIQTQHVVPSVLEHEYWIVRNI